MLRSFTGALFVRSSPRATSVISWSVTTTFRARISIHSSRKSLRNVGPVNSGPVCEPMYTTPPLPRRDRHGFHAGGLAPPLPLGGWGGHQPAVWRLPHPPSFLPQRESRTETVRLPAG